MELGELGREREPRREQAKEEEGMVRLSISRTAEKALVGVLTRVNSGFEAGQVSRSDGASWILLKYAESVSNDDIRALRMDHTDEIALLEHYLTTAKKSGKSLAPEVRDFLRKFSGLDEPQKKAPKKGLQKNDINDVIIVDEATAE